MSKKRSADCTALELLEIFGKRLQVDLVVVSSEKSLALELQRPEQLNAYVPNEAAVQECQSQN